MTDSKQGVVYIWQKIGRKQGIFLKLVHSKVVDFTKLEYIWKTDTYTTDLERVKKFDSSNRPILDFLKGHSIPIELGLRNEGDEPKLDDSHAFNQLFTNGVLRAILASATRLKADSPTVITILAGFGLGVFATIILAHFGILSGIGVSNGAPIASTTANGGSQANVHG